MPDRSRPGIPTTAYAIGTLQDGYDKLDTGSNNNNNNIIQRTHNNKQLSTSTKRRIHLPKHIIICFLLLLYYHRYMERQNTERYRQSAGINKIIRPIQRGCHWYGRNSMEKLW